MAVFLWQFFAFTDNIWICWRQARLQYRKQILRQQNTTISFVHKRPLMWNTKNEHYLLIPTGGFQQAQVKRISTASLVYYILKVLISFRFKTDTTSFFIHSFCRYMLSTKHVGSKKHWNEEVLRIMGTLLLKLKTWFIRNGSNIFPN